MKSGNLNFLEPSVPLQDCNETDLGLPNNASKGQMEFNWRLKA